VNLIAINFEDETFNNLCGGFRLMVQREPTVEEAEEIFKLTLLLYSYSKDVPTYDLSDFFVLSNALTYTGVELGITDLATHTTQWAGIYQYEEDYFFIHSVTDKGSTTIQVNLLSCFITTAPLFVASKVPDDIWSNFKEVYDQSYPDPPLVAPSIFKPFVVNPLKFLSI